MADFMKRAFRGFSKAGRDDEDPDVEGDDDDGSEAPTEAEFEQTKDLTVSCEITEAKEVSKLLKKHIKFVISVSVYYKEIPDARSTWHVFRRYREFAQLHDRLAQYGGKKIALPELPKTGLIRSTDPAYVEQKRKNLEQYLKQLTAIPLLLHSEAFNRFIGATIMDIFPPRDLLQEWQESKGALVVAQARALDAEKGREVAIAQYLVEQSNAADSKKRLDELEETVSKLRAGSVASSDVQTQLEQEARNYKQDALFLRGRVNDLESQSATLRTEATHTRSQLEELQAALAKAQEEVAELKAQKKLLVKEIKMHRRLSSSVGSPTADSSGGPDGAAAPPANAAVQSPSSESLNSRPLQPNSSKQ